MRVTDPFIRGKQIPKEGHNPFNMYYIKCDDGVVFYFREGVEQYYYTGYVGSEQEQMTELSDRILNK